MRVALIPPVTYMGDIERSQYQLVLPLNNLTYQYHYRMARLRGSYLILDNGAAEGKALEGPELVDLASQLMVHEVVVPDVVGNCKATIEAAKAFEEYARPSHFNHMGVIQGQTFEELEKCIEAFGEMEWINTFGIPRHLLTTLDEVSARVWCCEYIRERNGYFNAYDIHLLGTNPKYMNELGRYQEKFNRYDVRGVDTSAPYVYANERHLLDYGNEVHRPEGYFEIQNISRNLIDLNINKLLSWTNNG